MITAQNIKEKSFEKAVFGGYDMGGVDDFLDAVANDFAALQKENAVLKSKMKVLVDKIEEYRGSEDAMRLALVSAQKMSSEITEKAKAESAAMLADARRTQEDTLVKAKEAGEKIIEEAQAKYDALLRDLKHDVAAEENRLMTAKRSSASFIENMRLLCNRQLDLFDSLTDIVPGEREEEPVPAPEKVHTDEELEATIRSIEDSVAHAAPEPMPELDLPQDAEPVNDNPTRPFIPGKDDDGTPKMQFNFENLRFGK